MRIIRGYDAQSNLHDERIGFFRPKDVKAQVTGEVQIKAKLLNPEPVVEAGPVVVAEPAVETGLKRDREFDELFDEEPAAKRLKIN